jgi:hypothetical protein
MINQAGLERDCICAIEHFKNKADALEYCYDVLQDGYTQDEINEAMDNALKNHPEYAEAYGIK